MHRANLERVNTPGLAGLRAVRRVKFFGLRRFRKPFPAVLLLGALFPVFQGMAVLGYACQAYWSLGYWPSYNKPDPKTLGWWFEHNLLTLGFDGSIFLPALAVLVAIAERNKLGRIPVWIISGGAVFSLTTFIMYSRIDPFGVINWFWD